MNNCLRFFTDDIFSKFGFGDGDMLSNFLQENEIKNNLFGDVEHKILYQLFVFHVKPYLNRKKKLVFVETCHNPIRAKEDWLEDLADFESVVFVNPQYLYDIIDGNFFSSITRCCCIYFDIYVLSFIQNALWFFNKGKRK